MIYPQPGGYTTGNGRFASALVATLLSGAALPVGTTTSDACEMGDRGTIRANLAITGVSGQNPTLDLKLQTSPDNQNWFDMASFPQQTGVGSGRKPFAGADRYVRAVAVVGGQRVGTVASAGTAPPTAPTISGTPTASGIFDGNHTVVLTVSTGGALGTAAITVTIDGGTPSAPIAVPGNGIVNLGGGLSATFAAGTYDDGTTGGHTADSYTFATYQAPAVSAAVTIEGV